MAFLFAAESKTSCSPDFRGRCYPRLWSLKAFPAEAVDENNREGGEVDKGNVCVCAMCWLLEMASFCWFLDF